MKNAYNPATIRTPKKNGNVFLMPFLNAEAEAIILINPGLKKSGTINKIKSTLIFLYALKMLSHAI
ncbi:MAG: hypothetical protein H0A76_06745 [Candidatus Thiodubiliella endoseptemdiera]|uniref:Uncharacterized protein n=1 Tax=Candidatus Thiodubiliella endoseptemdiera TaxID=2738886 RepID=A0A853F263_9GAMM|nr:hypothetical protein [Candidatus Thiodubiliella endoseptemdiera]